ncbi:acyltransferase family protein [Sphingomonas alpina]|uniref:Acyltransferase n=1 Tax=Sphingomonas alpina TaxID=653931 RepID=A0A7H0LHT6_9SPHN|nr:acyltransferase [Sphingomonas alpina]QNQ09239.1 acyltransferase [Sphingomonas alpina]
MDEPGSTEAATIGPMTGRLYERWSLLAGARFLLASIVLLTHLKLFAATSGVVEFIGGAAFQAIAGFLLISGYSIGSSYKSRRAGFYIRRVERIYPAYIGAIGLAVAAYGWPGASVFAINLLFMNQLLTSQSFLGPAWSLSLEVWLYALTPLLALANGRLIWALALASFGAYIVYLPLITLMHLPSFSGLGYGLNLIMLSHFWLLGFIVATQPKPRRSCAIIAGLLVAGIGLACAIQFGSRFKNDRLSDFFLIDTPSFVWQACVLAFVVALLWLIAADKLPARKSSLLAWMGDISYPLYLVHVPVFVIFSGAGLASAMALTVATYAVAAGVMFVMEYPIRQMRGALRPRAIAGAQ